MPDNSGFRFRTTDTQYNEAYTIYTNPLDLQIISSSSIPITELLNTYQQYVSALKILDIPKYKVKKIKRNLPDWF